MKYLNSEMCPKLSIPYLELVGLLLLIIKIVLLLRHWERIIRLDLKHMRSV